MMEHLRNLQRLLADGFISPAEYEHRRQQLIDKLTNTTLASPPEDVRSNQNDKDRMERLRELKQASAKKRDVPLVRMRSEGATTTTSRATSSTTSTSTASYDSGVARTTSRTQGLRYEPYSSCAPAADPVMDLAQKYTLSRKIGQLPESALPSVLKIVERLSPSALRQDGGDDWTFDLETLEDRTLWKLNDFVNAQLKLHFGSEKTDACGSHEEAGMVEEEKYSASTITTESDPEDMEEDRDAGLDLNDDDQDLGSSSALGRDYWATSRSNNNTNTNEELKAAKRPRLLAFGAGEKRKKKEDIKKKGKERRERERAAMAAAAAAAKHVRSYSQERESESDEGEDALTSVAPRGSPFGHHMEEVRQLELRERGRGRDAVDEMEKESESEYEREEYEDPEYTSTDTQLKGDEEGGVSEGSDGDEESDEDWTPADNDRRSDDDYEDPADRRSQIVARDRVQPGAAQASERKMPSAPPPPAVKEKEGTGAAPGKTFKIQVCVYSLAKKSNTKKPYVCDACDKAFADRSNLIQHLRVHTKEKPYGCTYEGCEKRFAHSASLKEHLYTHTGDKPHVCNSPGCGMSFAQASNLRRHQLVHTGEKPFACEVPGCKKSFTQKINLAQHLKRVHKIVDNDNDNDIGGGEMEEEAEGATKRAVRRPSKRSRSTSSTSSSSSSHGMRGTPSSASKLGSR